MSPAFFLGSFGGLFALLAALFAWLWRGAARREREYLSQAVRVRGQVVELVESTDTDGGGTLWAPRVRYRDGAAEASFVGNTASRPPRFQVGQPVEVFHVPGDPSSGRLAGDGPALLKVAPILALSFGAVALVGVGIAVAFVLFDVG